MMMVMVMMMMMMVVVVVVVVTTTTMMIVMMMMMITEHGLCDCLSGFLQTLASIPEHLMPLETLWNTASSIYHTPSDSAAAFLSCLTK
jgi:hypothetical protein